MKKRNIYLNTIPLEEAKQIWKESLDRLIDPIMETINVEDSLGKISYSPVFADYSSPHYNASAMDGIAVRAKDTFSASEKNPVTLQEGEHFIYVNTGEMIKEGFDSVIMIEDVIKVSDNKIKIIKGAVPWQHVRPIGEDIVAKELIIPSKHKIRPVDIGAMLAGGINKINVYYTPIIGILPTGTEIIEPGEKAEKGRIIEYNSRVFSGMIHQWGGIPNRHNIVPDDFDIIKDTVKKMINECDAVIINAGSSAGSRDYTVQVIRELGKVYVHGIATKPGKPAILGEISGKPVIGIPGYPVSAYFVMDFFLKPLIEKYIGIKITEAEKTKAHISKKMVSSLKNEEFVRVKLGHVGDKLIASPLNRGAGVIMSLVRADGYMVIPRNSEGVDSGEKVNVYLMKSINDILNTLVIIGSHDPILDIISEMIHCNNSNNFVSSTHVGSMGGIMALMRDEAHMAGIHLLNMEDGSYNTTYIKKYLKNKEIALIHLVGREQGLMVKKGNPRKIKGFADLTRDDIIYVNRQKGSGTRLLLDYHLRKNNIKPEEINGYAREEYTHLTTAASIAEGSADTALGIYSAAIAMDLDFVPICTEQYDLAIPLNYLELKPVKDFLSLIKSEDFINQVNQMGGYNITRTGEIEIVK